MHSHIRSQFPFLQTDPNIIFLDTAASSQKPQSVIDGISDFYIKSYANIHRGSYDRADKATHEYEMARKKIAKFIGAESPREIIFTKNATESINLVARILRDAHFFQKGDRILISEMEHHANIVPWLQLKAVLGIEVEYIRMDSEKNLDMNHFEELLEKPVKLVAVTHVSNVLGTRTPVEMICKKAQENGALTLVDGSQAVPHFAVNVQDIGADFYVFSSHKMYGPSGVGILYGKLELLKKLPPFLGGGDMIHEVFRDSFSTNEVPQKFEAGTPPIAEAYGLGLACDFLESINMEEVEKHDKELAYYAYDRLSQISEIRILSNKDAYGLISFTVSGINDYDIGDELGERNICVRIGHHCAQPLMDMMQVNTTIRASFGVYSTKEEVDFLAQSLKEIIQELQ